MSEPSLNLAPGQVVAGRFRVDSPIGSGGHGHVVRATVIDTGRRVALKVLRPELVGSPEERGRFRREARVAQQLEHPNIVRMLEFGETAEGTCFIAFELLDGEPLFALLGREAPLVAARAARIATQVLKSLMAAHEQGVIHRDIKPGNVFLCRYAGEQDFVKVLDFGVAKPLVASGLTEAGLTTEGELIGTPSYMAPEQVAGLAVSPSTDLYALGLVMAECLSGRVVYPATDLRQVVMGQLSAEPVPLDPVVLASPLGALIGRATQKLPTDRFQSAAEMLAALEVAMGARAAVSIAVTPQDAQAARGSATALGTADTVLARDVLAPLVPPASGADSGPGGSPSVSIGASTQSSPSAPGVTPAQSWPGAQPTLHSPQAAGSWPGSHGGVSPAQASGSWPTAAPTLPSPQRPLVARSPLPARLHLVIGIGAALLAGAAAFTWVLMRTGDPRARSGSWPAPSSPLSAPVSKASCDQLRDTAARRVDNTPWTLSGKSASASSEICIISLQLRRGYEMAMVSVARGGPATYQSMLATEYASAGYAVLHQQKTGTVWAVFVYKDRTTAEQLLNAVADRE